jgi:hypothetical protein
LIAASRFTLVSCAAVIAAAQAFAGTGALAAPPVLRVKAKLSGFDGTVMQLQTVAAKGVKAGEDLAVSVTPETRYVGTTPSSFAAIKTGDYVGIAVSEQRGGKLRAQEIYLYADALRGTGEGRFPEGDRLLVNGAATALNPDPPGKNGEVGSGSITLHYRGALLSSAGPNRTVCEGRASPPAFASALSCEGDAVIEVRPGTQVSALSVGDKDLLQPGALVTVALTKAEGDKNVGQNLALGVVVEPPPPAAPSKDGTVEKPQSSP